MPKLVFTQEEVDNYIKERSPIKHTFYEKSVENMKEIAVHANGDFPEEIIEKRRPNEPEEVLKYRKEIWEPKTKPTVSRVISSLMKIRRSQDWSIKYPDKKFTRIREDESLKSYLEINFPTFGSITNWAFSLLLRKQLIDANGVVFVRSNDELEAVAETDFREPYPEIYDSDKVIDFVANDYAVLQNPKGSTYTEKGKTKQGRSYFFITTQNTLRYDQVDSKGRFQLANDYPHNLGILPVFKLKGILIDQADNYYLNESRIAGMIPELNEAAREYSDLQAARVNHIYPERYEYTSNECQDCKGRGYINNPEYRVGSTIHTKELECITCKGVGMKVAGPYSKIIIKAPSSLDPGAAVPTPPAGYVEKDVTIVKLQSESVDAHIYNALCAINFQFLDKVPLSESGKAKEVDQDELNNTVHAIAEDLVWAMDTYTFIAAMYRYNALYSLDEIREMLPAISVPEKFDLITNNSSGEEVAKAKTSKVNPLIISALELDYTSKRFYTEPAIKERLELIFKLDPLPNISDEEKMTRLSNKGISRIAYVVSCNIHEFVNRAFEEKKDFARLQISEMREIIRGYAEELISLMNQEAQAYKSPLFEDIEDDEEEEEDIDQEEGVE